MEVSLSVLNAQPLASTDTVLTWWESSTVIGPVVLMVVIIALYILVRRFFESRGFKKAEEKKSLEQPPVELKTKADAPVEQAIRAPIAQSEAAKISKPQEPNEVSEILKDDRQSWLGRLRLGLSKTRTQLQDNLSRLFRNQSRLSDSLLEDVHEVLYRSDMGVETADRLVQAIKRKFKDQSEGPTWEEAAKALEEEITLVFEGNDTPMVMPTAGPQVILVVGVNGVGKTTSIGKLAARYVAQGKSVLLGAGDTFRAAAIEQLQVWGERLNVPVIRQQQGADPASVAFDAVKAARSRGNDVLIIDTAGRLHSKQELMEELAKVKRVIGKELPGAPHETWLVIDATTGQNAVQQVKAFQEIIALTGLIVTKLDGTAKGGVIIGIRAKFQLPIRYIGVGEKAADLKEFSARDYAQSIFGA